MVQTGASLARPRLPAKMPVRLQERCRRTRLSGRERVEPLEQRFDPLRYLAELPHTRIGETVLDRCFDRGQQRRRGAGHVAEQDRLVMQPKLPPGDDLDGFVERTKAT